MTGLSLFTSDVDTVVMGIPDKQPIYAVGDGLYQKSFVLDESLEVIDKARIPIIKYVDAESNVSVDISFDEPGGVENTRLMKQYVRDFPAMPPMIIVLKYMLKQRKLDEVYTGGVGSYVLANMVVSFLQLHPRYRYHRERAEDNLGTALVEFLKLYGDDLNLDRVGISTLRGGSYFDKHQVGTQRKWKDMNAHSRICLEDPHNPSRDIGGASYMFQNIRRFFSYAFKVLQTALRRSSPLSTSGSALALLLYPDPMVQVRCDLVHQQVDVVRLGINERRASQNGSARRHHRMYGHLLKRRKIQEGPAVSREGHNGGKGDKRGEQRGAQMRLAV